MEQTERMAIRCSGITKTFGEVVANDQIELSVRFGEVPVSYTHLTLPTKISV